MKARTTFVRVSAIALAGLGLTSCAVTGVSTTRQFQRNFVPPVISTSPVELAAIDPPPTLAAISLYAAESPKVTGTIAAIPRPSDADFLIHSADEHFAAGKRALQQGNTDVARQEFDRAIEGLMGAPESIAERPRLERRLEELVDAIYRYDVDELGAGQQDDEVNYEKSPLDEIGDMTFPIDPSLRSRVTDQIRMTASQLPLEVQDPVVSFINYFSSTQGRKILSAGLRYAGRYRALIERILHEEGVPQELIFLAQAESGFQPRARSNKECVGLWQFASFRGKEYGLNQTASTDDRMDPEKATRAAARHLRDLYNHFGDWYLAMAAYNCGPACVDSAVMRTGYADFWTLRRLGVLPQETGNYVPIILAMTVMAKNPADYGLDMSDAEPAIEYDSVELESPTNLALIAAALDRPLSALKDLNPSLFRAVAPAGWTLHVPKGTLDQVEAAFRVIPASRRDAWRIHRVEAGDDFATIEKRYGLAAGTLSASNPAQAQPEPGSLIAVPVAYPGDPAPVIYRSRGSRAASLRSGAHLTARSTLHASPAHASSSARLTAAPTAHPAFHAPARTAARPPASRKPTATSSRTTAPSRTAATGTKSGAKPAASRAAGHAG